jgi:hypothetical protein
MQINNIEVTLLSLFFLLIVIPIITIINYNYSNSHLSILYIFAEPDNNNNNNYNENSEGKEDTEKKEKDKKKEEKKLEKKDRKEVVDREKKNNNNKNKEEKSNKEEKYSDSLTYDNNNNWTRTDQDLITKYNYRNLAIPKIYQNAPIGETYRFNKTNPSDKVQVDEGENKKVFTKQNRDGSWRIDFGKPRIDIHTKDAEILPDKVDQLNNLSEGKIQSWNYSELKEIGYWYKPSDWKNIEVTLIFKILDSSRSKGEQHSLSIVTRSISHSQLDSEYKKSKDEPKFFCGGSSYHNNISNDGNVRMKKEQFHINYEWERYNEASTVGIGNLYDKIVGFKSIIYNVNDTAVKLESWVDVENGGKGPYKKVHELIDNGDWGDAMKVCGAETDTQAITWGSPIVILKANDFKFDIYDVEIREIVPPSQYT